MTDLIPRARFDHIGIVSDDRRDGESWVEPTRVWVTNPRAHPYHVEFLRFEPDTPLSGPVRDLPHVAFRVDDLEQAIGDHPVLLGPFEVGGGFAQVVFVDVGGAVVEFMQYRDPSEEGWF